MCAYPGGKSKNAEHILRILNDPMWDGYQYYEPFVGMAHVLRRVRNKASYVASDSNELLIHLLRCVKEGATIPHITRERYSQLKAQHGVTLERAVAAHTFSFNGKPGFAGYTHTYTRPNGKVDDMAESRRRYYKILEANETFRKADLQCCDYNVLQPSGALVYCDPPYAGTTGYAGTHGTAFDTDTFWRTAREWSRHNVVFVSEYSAPTDWACYASSEKRCSLAGGDKQTVRVERLFVHRSALARIEARRHALPL